MSSHLCSGEEASEESVDFCQLDSFADAELIQIQKNTIKRREKTFEKDKKHLIQIRTHPIVVELKTLDDAAPIQMT